MPGAVVHWIPVGNGATGTGSAQMDCPREPARTILILSEKGEATERE
jgi:hypothetical protein